MRNILGKDAYDAARKKTRGKLSLYRETVYSAVKKALNTKINGRSCGLKKKSKKTRINDEITQI